MGLFGFFRRRRESAVSETALAVVSATAREGFAPNDAVAVRDIIKSACPADFHFLSPTWFQAYFHGDAEGVAKADQLVNLLRAYAAEHALTQVGVGMSVGLCIIQQRSDGSFTSHPLGETISRSMQLASHEAKNAL